jgi:hypothetical protein
MLTWFNKTNDDLPEHESSFSGNTVGFVKGSEVREVTLSCQGIRVSSAHRLSKVEPNGTALCAAA